MDGLDKINCIYKEVSVRSEKQLEYTVRLGDVLDRVFSQENITQKEGYLYTNMILEVREELREPVEDQTDECIDLIYSILKTNANDKFSKSSDNTFNMNDSNVPY